MKWVEPEKPGLGLPREVQNPYKARSAKTPVRRLRKEGMSMLETGGLLVSGKGER